MYMLRLGKARAMVNCCRRLFSPVPLQAAYTEQPVAADLVAQVAAAGNFDILHVEHIRGAHLTQGVEGMPMIYDSVDCITRLLKQKLSHESGTLAKALGWEELFKMRSYEARVAAGFDKVVITSERDKRILGWLIRKYASAIRSTSMPEKRIMRSLVEELQDNRLSALHAGTEHVSIVRNGVDHEYFAPMPQFEGKPMIVFSGKMSYSPNVTAVLKFYKEVYPLVKREVPDVGFTIVGSDPPESIRRLVSDPSVKVTGYVPDIRSYIASARVVVCPMTIGVGIQNKVLEAMSMSKPVVVSSIACRGIPDAIDTRHLMRADDPAPMSKAVIELLKSPEKGRVLGRHARQLVQDEYSWAAAAKSLEKCYMQSVDIYNKLCQAA